MQRNPIIVLWSHYHVSRRSETWNLVSQLKICHLYLKLLSGYGRLVISQGSHIELLDWPWTAAVANILAQHYFDDLRLIRIVIRWSRWRRWPQNWARYQGKYTWYRVPWRDRRYPLLYALLIVRRRLGQSVEEPFVRRRRSFSTTYQFLRPMSTFGWSIVVEQAFGHVLDLRDRSISLDFSHSSVVWQLPRADQVIKLTNQASFSTGDRTRTYRDSGSFKSWSWACYVIWVQHVKQPSPWLWLVFFPQVIYKSTESETLRLHEGSINTKSKFNHGLCTPRHAHYDAHH